MRLAIFLIVAGILIIDAEVPECPTGFIKLGKKCYWITNESNYRVNFFKADMICRQHGSNLLTIEHPEELLLINDYLISKGWNIFAQGCIFWTSSNCLSEERKFYWQSNGQLTDLDLFGKGEPNNVGGNENCVDLRSINGGNFSLCDVACEKDFANFICEVPTRDSKWCACTTPQNTLVSGPAATVC